MAQLSLFGVSSFELSSFPFIDANREEATRKEWQRTAIEKFPNTYSAKRLSRQLHHTSRRIPCHTIPLLLYYYRKKRFRWRNVKRLQEHLTYNAKDSDKTRVRRKVKVRTVFVRCDRGQSC